MSNNPVKYVKGSLQTIEIGSLIELKNGVIAKVIEAVSSDGKKFKRFVFVQGSTASEMEDLRKKRRGGVGQGVGRRQQRKPEGVSQIGISEAREKFHEHYNKKAKKIVKANEGVKNDEVVKQLASELKAGDISRNTYSQIPLDPNKPSHINLYASKNGPEKYDMEGIDTPGSKTKSPLVKGELLKIKKERAKSIKKAREAKKED